MSRVNRNKHISTAIPSTIYQSKINFESAPFVKTQTTGWVELKRLRDEDKRLLKAHPDWKACEKKADEIMKKDFRTAPSTSDMRR